MPRRTLVGTVVSVKCDETITVLVISRVMHKTGKIVKRSKKYAAHDPENRCVVGDNVVIEECAPISKTKTWKLVQIGHEE